MNAAERELLRLNLLQQLAVVAPHPLPIVRLALGALIGGFNPSSQELAAELDYLEQKALIAPASKLISPENREWKIAAEGRDLLAAKGLA